MVKNNILIGSHSKKVCLTILNVLKKYGITPSYVCQSSSNFRKMANYFGEGVIIISEKLIDEYSINIIDDFWENFNIILIGNLAQINMCEDKKAYKLSIPLKQEELILALEMQLYKETPKKSKNNNENKIINEAKKILFEKNNLTEENAHKYLQKLSMQKKEKLINIAKNIIENKGELL